MVTPGPVFLLLISLCQLGSSDSTPNDGQKDAASSQLNNYKGTQKKERTLTTGWGSPVGDRGNVLTAGAQGPLLIQDVDLIDELQHLGRERIPRRVVYGKGAGAFGYFTVTDDITKYCKASLFSKIGKKTPVAVRFSLEGETMDADSDRGVRGFAVKFYTGEGIWDLVGNHLPVFPVRDPYLYVSYIHSQNRNPVTNLNDLNAFWDFRTLRTETTLLNMMVFSDKGIPLTFTNLPGYGVNTFTLVNALGEVVYCKFKYEPDQGRQYLNEKIAEVLGATSSDYAARDLYNTIAQGKYPSWTLYIQVVTLQQAQLLTFNPLDPTKYWSEDNFPPIKVGQFILNKNPQNHFVDVEQLAFNPGHLVPGIQASTDKILQARMFPYSDTQLYRLGTNYLQLPVNSPFRNNISNTQRDGEHCYTDNQGGAPNYYPNSFVNQLNTPTAHVIPYSTHGEVFRYNSSGEDDFTQPRELWRTYLESEEKVRLITNLAESLKNTYTFIQERAVINFLKVDEEFGTLMKRALKL